MKHAREIPWLGKRKGVYNIFWHVPAQRDPVTGEILARRRTNRLGLRTRDPLEAQKRYVAFLSEGQDVVAGVARDTGLTVSQALDDYWREHVTAKDERGKPRLAAPDRQEYAIRNLKAYFGDTLIKHVDIPASNAYVEARRAGQVGGGRKHKGDRKKGSDGTIRRELTVLTAAANHARKWKRLGVDEMPVVEKPKGAEYADEAKWLTRNELALVTRNASGRLLDFITLAYWWGARRAWVEQLHVDQVDLENGRVNAMRAGEKRTKKRRGVVPIFPEQRETLERLCASAHEHDGYLFGGHRESWAYKPFCDLLDSLGLENKRNPHVLRHSRATHMLMDGESIYKVAKLLHDTVTTVEHVYGHHSPEFLAEKAA